MFKTDSLNAEFNLIENDTQYEVVPRRRSERRSKNSPRSKSEFTVENDNINVQKMNKKRVDFAREGERRQSGRRNSRPTLLSVDEIVVLRKN
tara:strand:+ start:228553 stop:228828 length:276 start_codon:yes stop_codon:yes gene_type:complete